MLYAGGILLIFQVIGLSITAWSLLPGLALYGVGIGFAIAQLTNVVLSEVPMKSAGVASGANSTGRQVGSALGVSVIGSILTIRTASAATSALRASTVAANVKAQAIAGIHTAGSGYAPPGSLSAGDANAVRDAIAHGVISGTRLALLFAVVVIAIGAIVSLLIPSDVGHPIATAPAPTLEPDELVPRVVGH